MLAVPNLFTAAGGYVHEVGRLIRDGWWWAPGPDMPTTAGASRVQAEIEAGRFEGANIVTLCLIAVEDLAERHPETFGPIESLDAYNAERARVEAHRVRTADAVAAIPAELLRGVASVRGVAIEPVRDLARRLIESALANPERVAMASRA